VTDLVAALLFVAEDLDARHYPFAGAVRQGARRITELEAIGSAVGPVKFSAPGPNACERCGAPLEQRSTGRPRKWCSESCRDLARKVPGNATLLKSLTKGEP
jgi:hypothetical protein